MTGHPTATDILLANVHSCRNAGDAALTEVAIAQLKEQFPHSRITLAMDDPASHTGEGQAIDSLYGLVKEGDQWNIGGLVQLLPASLLPILTYRLLGGTLLALTPKRWRAVIQAYTQANLVVSKPGGFLYSSGRGVSLLVSIYTLALAELAGKPVYLLPQSIGPLSRWWEHVALKQVLRRARMVMVREPISLRQLEAWGLPADSYRLLPDPAFSYPSAPASSAKEWLRKREIEPGDEAPLLGMTAINWEAMSPRFEGQARYETACAETARLFVERYGGKVIVFPQVRGPASSQDDRVPARRIADRLPELSSSVLVVEEPIAAAHLKAIYGLMSLFVGTRMHSNIFALSEGVPVVAIGYQPKTRGILEMMGLEQWAIGIDEVTPQSLSKKLMDLWDAQEEVRSHLQRVMPKVMEQASRGGALIAADFSGQEKASEHN